MAKGSRYRMPLKRRREGKTNYYKRRKMIISGKPRLVVRILSRGVVAQVIEAKPRGDVTLVSAVSKELSRYGWKAGGKNLPAAYLVGMLAALKAKKKGIEEAILDIGLHAPTRGARVFAAAKGAVDAGLHVPLGESVIPDEERIRGEHIAAYASMLAEEDEEAFKRRFSGYLASGFDPRSLPQHFEEVKGKILSEFSEG